MQDKQLLDGIAGDLRRRMSNLVVGGLYKMHLKQGSITTEYGILIDIPFHPFIDGFVTMLVNEKPRKINIFEYDLYPVKDRVD